MRPSRWSIAAATATWPACSPAAEPRPGSFVTRLRPATSASISGSRRRWPSFPSAVGGTASSVCCTARAGMPWSSIRSRKWWWNAGPRSGPANSSPAGARESARLLPDERRDMIRVANAPVSWGVLEFEGTDGRADYSLVLDEIRETGYAGTELGDWGFLPTDPTELRRELGRRELALLGAFVPVALADPRSHAAGREAAVRVARLMVQAAGDQPFIVLSDENGRVPLRMQNAGRIRPEHGLRDDPWRTFGEGAARLAESVRRETGLRAVFHHHCAGYVETPGELDRLLELTDPDVLGLCLDTGHYRFGGGDPAQAVRRHAGRIWHVHFKDYDPPLAT